MRQEVLDEHRYISQWNSGKTDGMVSAESIPFLVYSAPSTTLARLRCGSIDGGAVQVSSERCSGGWFSGFICCLHSFVNVTESQESLEKKLDELLALPVTTGPGASLEPGILAFSNPCVEEMPVAQPDGAPGFEDASVKLNNVDANMVAVPPVRLNVNVNKQEDPVKLLEKCLNNNVEAPLWPPSDIKSNILKAQVEAGQKNVREDLGISHMTVSSEETSSRSVTVKTDNRLLVPESPDGEPQIPAQTVFITKFGSQELKESKLDSAVTPSTLPPPEEAPQIKSATDDLDLLLASLTENLIDLTEAPPPAPPQVPSYVSVAPRWLIPSGVVSNGHLGAETSQPPKILNNVIDSPPAAAESLNVTQVPASTSSTGTPAERTRSRCLMTTEL